MSLEKLISSSTSGDTIAVVKEIGAGVDVNGDFGDSFPLYCAASNGHTDVVNELIKANADVNKDAPKLGTALYSAATYGHTEVAKVLIKHKAYLHACFQGATPLFSATFNGHAPMVRELLIGGANVNLGRESDNTSPLIVAARGGDEKVLYMLIAAGANVRAESGYGPPVWCALDAGNPTCASILMQAGALVDDRINTWVKGKMNPMLNNVLEDPKVVVTPAMFRLKLTEACIQVGKPHRLADLGAVQAALREKEMEKGEQGGRMRRASMSTNVRSPQSDMPKPDYGRRLSTGTPGQEQRGRGGGVRARGRGVSGVARGRGRARGNISTLPRGFGRGRGMRRSAPATAGLGAIQEGGDAKKE